MEIKDRFCGFANPIPFIGCWIWSGSLHQEGYGRFALNGKTQKAHRVSYEIFKGKIPDGKLVCHSCDEPSCVNPDHLFIGTNYTNNLDKTKKGRAAKKLSADQVKEIRLLLAGGFGVTMIGKKYGVTHSMIIRIKNQQNWKGI